MNDAVIVLQARSASRRLPGKALAAVGARSLLAHAIVRLRADAAAPVILATTTKAEDDALARVAELYGATVVRGPEDDVLARFVLAARSVRARYVVRATADNPAIDIGGPRRVLAALISTRADHVIEEGLPYGAAVEAVTVAALSRAWSAAADPADREHVTQLIRRDRTQFKPIVIPAPRALWRPDVRLTIDTARDLHAMRQLADRLDGWSVEPELHTILSTIDAGDVGTRCA